jgi:RHS repeat-associated protein
VTEVVAETTDGRISEVQRSASSGGTTVTESYLFAFVASGDNAGLISGITQRRKVGAGSWSAVRSVEYTYHDGTTAHGNAQDLRTAVVKDAAGAVLETSYYRYYVVSGGGEEPPIEEGMMESGPEPIGGGAYQSGLKYVLKPEAYARAVGAGLDPLTATDEQLSPYANHYFEFDDQFRVTKETAAGAGDDSAGGLGTFTYTYTPTEFLTATIGGVEDYNAWQIKTVETLPDATTNTVYTNVAKQVMLTAYTAGSQTWHWFHRYDEGGRLVLSANPSAVTGYSDQYADLVNYQSGNAQYLADSAGLVTAQEYGTSTTATDTAAGDAAGRLKRVSLKRGETGTAVPQQDVEYVKRTVGTQDLFFEAEITRYRNDDGTGAQTITTAYTWQGTTAQPASVAVTLPAVSAAQNGPGTATTVSTVFDAYGRPVWERDGDGYITYVEYDPATGAAVKRIVDVDTTQTATFQGLPSGWATPAGGGLHLTTTTEVDALGRPAKMTRPNGRVDYSTYNDVGKEVRTYSGWDAATNTPAGPTQVIRADWARGYTETITMSAAPAVSGGRPTGTEAVSGLQTLSRVYTNPGGQTVYSDAYFDLSGLTYTTGTALGTQNTHFYRTLSGYDARGRQDRSVSPAGTVTRTVYDGPGRAVSVWVGLDDTPATGDWSPANTAGTDLVKVREAEYDGGGVGDGNLTKATEYPGLGAAARVTHTWYDWRNRPVAVKEGVEASEGATVNRPVTYTQFDNLGQAVAVERYDGDGVTVTTTNGVPDRPAASLLRAKAAAEYDDLGQLFRSKAYSVDPATGAVSTAALTTAAWFDRRGNTIKLSAPGGLVEKTKYDGAGRATAVYTTDGAGDAAWADAGTVTGDAVLSQVEIQYDGGGNPILQTTRERFHDDAGTGALGTPTAGVKARVSYTASYYDLADRLTASVDVGTNSGTAWTRPTAVPARSDTVLVTGQVYDAAGRVRDVTDPRGLVTRIEYDPLGRVTKTVENYVDGVPSDGDDKTTEYGYGPAGRTSLTARLTGGGGQTTQWVYGVTTAGGSGVNSNDIIGATRWPDPATGAASAAEQETVTVNTLGQPVARTDRNGTVHAYTYDVLGRETADAVTTLGAFVDGAVRRVETAYDGQGNPYLLTSYDAATGGSVMNQVKREFNGLGQLVSDWQSHAGAVTGSTPRVQYAYSLMSGGANHSRLTAVTYPNGRVLTWNYAAGLGDAVSRLSSLSDSTGTLETYDYLGQGTVVRWGHPQPGVDLTYVKQSGESNGDAGDPYTGLDRFGRVVDQRWRKASDGSHTDRFTYTYDRDSNRTAKGNLVNAAFGETYGYDGLNQLTSFARTGRTQAWDYDALGNWEAVTTDGTAQTRTHNRQNEVTGVSGATAPTFDPAGNMTGDETSKQFVYDAWNRLVRVKDTSGATLVAFTYDGLGRRVGQTAGGTVTDLYYSDDWQVLEERVGGATVQYVWSPVYVDALVLRDRDADGNGTLEERLYAQQDANWNVTALVNASGAVVERLAYDPFGTQTVYDASFSSRSGSSYGWVVGFQGLRHDAASGLSETDHRWYSPTIGRWATTDPLGFDAGDVNLYRFVGNGPTNRVDPSGLSWLSDAWDAVNLPGALYDYAVASYNNIGAEKPINTPPRDFTDARSRDQLPAAGTNGQGSVGDNRRNVADSVKGGGAFVATVAAAVIIEQFGGRGADKVGDTANAIIKWLGKDAKVIKNAAGDTIVQSADGLREVRFDFNHTAPHANPHTHVIEYEVVRGKKVEKVNKRIYPHGVDPK